MKNIAILITTFLRDDALFACVKSIRGFYLNIAIFIADMGHESKAKDDFLLLKRNADWRVAFTDSVWMETYVEETGGYNKG